MKKIALGAALAAISLAGLTAGVDAARPDGGGGGQGGGHRPTAEGKACLRAGNQYLRENHLKRDAARRKINWALIDANGPGDPVLGAAEQIRIDLGDTAYIPLGRFLKMHLRQPETFAWCDAPEPTTPEPTTTAPPAPEPPAP